MSFFTELPTFQTTFQQAANGLRNLEQLFLTIWFQRESIDKDLLRSLVRVVVSLGADGSL